MCNYAVSKHSCRSVNFATKPESNLLSAPSAQLSLTTGAWYFLMQAVLSCPHKKGTIGVVRKWRCLGWSFHEIFENQALYLGYKYKERPFLHNKRNGMA